MKRVTTIRRPPPNMLDRVIAAVAPVWAVKRLAARHTYGALSGGYAGGNRARRATKHWRPGGGSADAEVMPDLAELRDRSRDLTRNTPIATAALNRATTNVVGPGLRPQPSIDRAALGLEDDQAEQWEDQATRVFSLWAESRDCDVSRRQPFAGLQELAFRATFESGDCFTVRQIVQGRQTASGLGLALQLYEADQVCNPQHSRDGTAPASGNRIVGGVELDSQGAPTRYHFLKKHPGNVEGDGARQWVAVPAFGADSGAWQVLHLYRRLRIGQTRGVPELAPVIESLKQLGTYAESELMAAVIGAMLTIVYKTSGGESLPEPDPSADTSPAQETDYGLAAGWVLELDSDDEISVPNPGRPNREFDPFFVAIVRQIGAAIEIPFEVLMLHFTSSYSASRAALEMAWQFFRARRRWLVSSFCQPVYEAVLTEAIATGMLSAPGFFTSPLARRAWLGAVWIGPGRPSIDPLRERKAAEIEENRGWRSGAQIVAEISGDDWDSIHRQRAREERLRKEAGLTSSAGSSESTGESDDDSESTEDESRNKGTNDGGDKDEAGDDK